MEKHRNITHMEMGTRPPSHKWVTAMIRRRGRKRRRRRRRRIVQRSKNLVAQLSPSLCAAMLCHIKARGSSRWDGVVSRERGVRSGRERKLFGDGRRRRRWLIADQGEQEGKVRRK